MTKAIIIPMVLTGICMLLLFTHIKAMSIEASVTIAVASVIAVTGWFVSTRLKTKLDLELQAVREIQHSLTAYSKSLSDFHVLVGYDPTIPFDVLESNKGWSKLAAETNEKVHTEIIKVMRKQSGLRDSIDANEIAVVELQHFYQYIMMKHDELIERFADVSGKYIILQPETDSVESYIELTRLYKVIVPEIFDILGYTVDLNKILQNKFQSKLFGHTVNRRKPLDGSKTLDELATVATVRKMKTEREAAASKLG